MGNQVLQEQIVATIQPHIRFQEIPEVQFVQRTQEQFVETIKVVSQERATQRTSEQLEVQMNTSSTSTSEKTVDIPILRSVEEMGEMSVQLSTQAINECMHSLKRSKEKVAQIEEVTSSLRSRLQVLTESLGSRHAARQAENELDLVVAQLREEQQSLVDKKQLFADTLREKQHLFNMKRRPLDI